MVYPGQERWPMAENVEALPIQSIFEIFEGR